jgi:hypothetical protein
VNLIYKQLSVLVIMCYFSFNATYTWSQVIILPNEVCSKANILESECTQLRSHLADLVTDYSNFRGNFDQTFIFNKEATHSPDYTVEDQKDVPFKQYLLKWEEAQKVTGKTFKIDSVEVRDIKKNADDNWMIELKIIKRIAVIYYPGRAGWVELDPRNNTVVLIAEVLWKGFGGPEPKIYKVKQKSGIKIRGARPSITGFGFFATGTLPIETSRTISDQSWKGALGLSSSLGLGLTFSMPLFKGAINFEIGVQYGRSKWSTNGPTLRIEGNNPYVVDIQPLYLESPGIQAGWIWDFRSFSETINSNNFDGIAGLSIPVLKKRLKLSLDVGVMYGLMNSIQSVTTLTDNNISAVLIFDDEYRITLEASQFSANNPPFPLVGQRSGNQLVNGTYTSTSFMSIYGGLSLGFEVNPKIDLILSYRLINSLSSPVVVAPSSNIYGTILKEKPADSNGFISEYFDTGNLIRHQFNAGITYKF